MKVYNQDLSPLNATDQLGRKQPSQESSASSGDDTHLSELVRSLRALAADSPERQERLEQIARACANGTYKVDADASAAKIVDDTLRYR